MEINKDKKNKSSWLIKHLSIFILFWGFIPLLLIGPTQFYSEYSVFNGIGLTIFLNYIIFYATLFYFRPKNSKNRNLGGTVVLLSIPILTLGYPIFEQTGNYNIHQLERQFLIGLGYWCFLILFVPFCYLIKELIILSKKLNITGTSYNTGYYLNKLFNEEDKMYRFQYKTFQGNWVENNAKSFKPDSLTIQHFLTMGLKLSNDIMRNHPAGWQPAARLIDPNGNVIETMM
jgi:hypothetical protein